MYNCRTSITKGHKEQHVTCGKTASPPPRPGLNKALKLKSKENQKPFLPHISGECCSKSESDNREVGLGKKP